MTAQFLCSQKILQSPAKNLTNLFFVLLTVQVFQRVTEEDVILVLLFTQLEPSIYVKAILGKITFCMCYTDP